jgi:subtilisin family serine protease
LVQRTTFLPSGIPCRKFIIGVENEEGYGLIGKLLLLLERDLIAYRMKKILWMVLWGGLLSNAYGQQSVISSSSVENRARIIGELPRNQGKLDAEAYARRYGLPVRKIYDSGRIIEIQRIENGRHPLYNETHNINAARTVSTDRVWDGEVGGYHLRGKNILVGLWDAGKIRTTHTEFGSRVYTLDSGFEIVGHATHVAGTIGAAGLDSKATGMANQCFIEGYDWDNDDIEMRQAAQDGLLLSNHSYGYIHGFDYNSEERRWEWYGDIDIDEKEDFRFGFYNRDAREWDDVAYDNPYYLIVKSAGNDRLEGPANGGEHYVYDGGWKVSYKLRNLDGGPDGFDCIGTRATAKNILTVGAVNDIENGFQGPEDVVMTNFSTFGPTDDGRIKPDIVGNGTNLYSSYNESDNDYNILTGTSMATPNVAGSLALLQELHHKKYGTYMKSATLKGLVLHSADDAGNEGPDYKFGWGLLNTRSAASLIIHPSHPLLEDSIMEGEVRRFNFYAPGDSSIKVTLCWTDPRGPFLPDALDPTDLILVNDLDVRLIRSKDSAVTEPYILDPGSPEDPAERGDNFRDNVEQIVLPLAAKGYYEVVISHKNSLTDSMQHLSLIAEGLARAHVAEEVNMLHKNNGFLQVTDAPEYPVNRRFTWLIEPTNQQPVNLSFTAFSTSVNDTVAIFDGPGSDSPLLAEFSGMLFNPDTLLITSGGSLYIEFSSGNEEGFEGFSARYCTVSPEEMLDIKGEGYPCSGSEEVYFFDPLPESEYRWTLSQNIQDSAEIYLNTAMLGIPDDSFYMRVTPENRCGTGPSSERVVEPLTAPPDISPVISGDTVPCTNGPNLYAVEYDPAATYWWSLPKDWIGRSDSASIHITPVKEPGTIGVVPVNSCGESPKIELMVHPVSLPRIPVIESEKINPCPNEVYEFHVQAEEAVDYRWNAEAGWDIVGPDTLPQVSVLVGDGSAGRMFLTSSNKCGDTSTSRNFLLSPTPLPPIFRTQASGIEGLDELVLLNYEVYALVDWYRDDSLYAGYHEKTLTLHRNGTYSVQVMNSDGCVASMDNSEKIKIDNQSLLYSISTGSEGVIRVENDAAEPARIQVYDLTGRIVFSDELQPGTNTYHTARRGLLIFRIEGDTHLKTQMIFVH